MLSEEIQAKIAGLALERLEALAEELLDFTKVEELNDWIDCNRSYIWTDRHLAKIGVGVIHELPPTRFFSIGDCPKRLKLL